MPLLVPSTPLVARAARAVRDRLRPAAPTFGPLTLPWTNLTPLLHRIGRGEGLLLAVNLSLVLVAQVSPRETLVLSTVSVAALAILYFVNDVWDCRRDLIDAGKDATFVRFCVTHRTRLQVLAVAEMVALVVFALVAAGPWCAGALVANLLVNVGYSTWFKGRPALDVAWVVLWGGSYVALSGPATPLAVIVLAGAMTGVCHVFQMRRDRAVDARNGVRTSAVAKPWLPAIELALCCFAMALVLYRMLGLVAAATAAVPFVTFHMMRSNQNAWLLAKASFAVVWLLVLGAIHGT
jgi:hypothetical protein